jgi:hypothetical protein
MRNSVLARLRAWIRSASATGCTEGASHVFSGRSLGSSPSTITSRKVAAAVPLEHVRSAVRQSGGDTFATLAAAFTDPLSLTYLILPGPLATPWMIADHE